MFRDAFKSRRCVVPARAWYEWLALPEGKMPVAFDRVDGTPIALAGVWEGFKWPSGVDRRGRLTP